MTDHESARELKDFAKENGLEVLTLRTLQAIKEERPQYTLEKGRKCAAFRKELDEGPLRHRIIRGGNLFTNWFEKGNQSLEQVQEFSRQFSVFSNLFLIAAMLRVIHAPSLEARRKALEIIVSELGVIFKTEKMLRTSEREIKNATELEPAHISAEGTVDGGTYRFIASHYEWILKYAKPLGFQFNDIGQSSHGSGPTIYFCNKFMSLYGSNEYARALAASYLIENWAAAGFWKQLVSGLKLFNERNNTKLPLGFFIYHDMLEGQHALHTQEELEEEYFETVTPIAEDLFIRYCNEMLEGLIVFWDGLEAMRLLYEIADPRLTFARRQRAAETFAEFYYNSFRQGFVEILSRETMRIRGNSIFDSLLAYPLPEIIKKGLLDANIEKMMDQYSLDKFFGRAKIPRVVKIHCEIR